MCSHKSKPINKDPSALTNPESKKKRASKLKRVVIILYIYYITILYRYKDFAIYFVAREFR